jgi:hypothetical protein
MKPTRDERHRATLGNRFRFLVRLLGLLALLAVPAGVVLMHGTMPPPDVGAEAGVEAFRGVLGGGSGLAPHVGAVLVLAGAAVLLVWLLVELVGVLFLVTGRRSAIGLNAVVQVIAAATLLVAVNALSFTNYVRYDATRDRHFTLPADLVNELKRLRSDSPTTVVVLRQGAQSTLVTAPPDAYDDAAQAKVVEKVNDLVAQLREFGPRFNVVALDTKSVKYARRVAELTATRPGLAAELAAAPESSIFFYADEKVTGPADARKYTGRVARMPFRDFYQLDKTASLAAAAGGPPEGQGNLVLLTRGPEAFVRRLLTLDARRPRVALAVIHPLLTTRETVNDYSAAGLRTALVRNGFEVTDIILKQFGRGGPPVPAARTYAESELDRGEARYKLLNLAVAQREALIREIAADTAAADKLIAKADATDAIDPKRKALTDAAQILQAYVGQPIRSEGQVRSIVVQLKTQAGSFQEELAELQKQVSEAGNQYRDLLRDDRAVESRRLTDVPTKLRQYTADADILILPRVTVVDVVRGDTIPSSVFDVSVEQAAVVKEFLAAGKPVLFALGPPVSDGRGPAPGPDAVEALLPQFGIIPGRQTILTDKEAVAIAERQGDPFAGGGSVTAAVSFEAPRLPGQAPNPIAEAFRTTARAVDKSLDLKKGGYRPIYLAPGVAARSPFAPEILLTGPTSFNEDNPVPTADTLPKYEPSRPDDPKRGTREEERRGPFPVGVCVEEKIPADWVGKSGGPQPALAAELAASLALPFDHGVAAACAHLANAAVPRPTVRLVVLGHGGLFTGLQLDGAQETLLVDCLNWQLKRDDALPVAATAETTWQYPRADLTPTQFFQWSVGAFVGLPAAIAVVGLIALMIRKVR